MSILCHARLADGHPCRDGSWTEDATGASSRVVGLGEFEPGVYVTTVSFPGWEKEIRVEVEPGDFVGSYLDPFWTGFIERQETLAFGPRKAPRFKIFGYWVTTANGPAPASRKGVLPNNNWIDAETMRLIAMSEEHYLRVIQPLYAEWQASKGESEG